MKKLSRTVMIGIAVLCVLALRGAAGAPEASSEKLKDFMGAKLKYSQNALAGLVNEDYTAIAKHGQDLSLMSLESTWEVYQTEKYLQHSGEFRRAADAMTKAAKAQNIDGATLAYVDMTMTCVACHKYVRGVRTVSLPSDNSVAVRPPH
jgi:hypothetical protein